MTAKNEKINEYKIGNTAFPVWTNRKGYACVTIPVDGKDRAYLLHKLVWESNHGPVPDGHELHHIDHDKANWSLSNLKPVEKNAHQQYHRDLRSTGKSDKAGKDEGNKVNPNHNPEKKTP